MPSYQNPPLTSTSSTPRPPSPPREPSVSPRDQWAVNTHVRSTQQPRYTLDPQWNMCILHTWSFQTDGKWGRKRTELEPWGWREDAKEQQERRKWSEHNKRGQGKVQRLSESFTAEDVLYTFMQNIMGLKEGTFHYCHGFTCGNDEYNNSKCNYILDRSNYMLISS